jgi:hypothetical protein
MFLRNWKNIQAIRLFGSVETAQPNVFGGSSRALKAHNGSIGAGALSWFASEGGSGSYSSSQLCGLKISGGWTNASGAAALSQMIVAAGLGPLLAPGSGTGKENEEDFSLSDITELSHVGYSYGIPYRSAAGRWVGWVSRTMTNNSSAPVTVSELGIYLPLYNGASGSPVSMAVLVYRKLLAEPVTLGVGESYNFTLKFDMG